MKATRERIADTTCEVGEGPLWHPADRCLYWCDITAGSLFQYDPSTGDYDCVYRDDVIGGFTIQEDGSLLLFGENCSIKAWRNDSIETVVEEIPAERGGRFNDVIADPNGRVYAGTVPTADHSGRIYLVEPDGRYQIVLDNYDLPNGMGFTPNGEQMYVTDTGYFEEEHPGRIYVYDYDSETGDLTDRRTLVEIEDVPGRPDGMTVDEEGFIWSAQWGGGCVVRYSPEGDPVDRLNIPAKKVACPTFGGEEYGELYVTTAGGEHRETDGDGAGAVFRCNTGISGVPEFRSRIEV